MVAAPEASVGGATTRPALGGSVRAEGGVSPPVAAGRTALGVYRGPAARSPRPPPCALLTSFILSHPRPPTPNPNSDSPRAASGSARSSAVALQALNGARKTGATS